MPTKKKGLGSTGSLGRRLKALGLSEARAGEGVETVMEISVADVVPSPRQARKVFDEDALETLAASIRRYGIVQPVVVQRRGDGKYELIAGERRWRAAQRCGLEKLPALVKDYEESVATEISLIENLQREDLNALEEAAAYEMLIADFGLTQEQAAEKVGKSRSHVANMIRLLRLPQHIRQMMAEGILTMGQARPLLQIEAEPLQLQLAERIADEELSARQAEALVRSVLARKEPEEQKSPEQDAFVEAARDRIKMSLGTAVSIKMNHRKKRGRIEISFASPEEFERLLALLTQEEEKSGSTGTITSFSL